MSKSGKNSNLVGPPPLTQFIFPINYAGGGVVPHLGYPVAHFGNPAQQGQADVIRMPRTDAGRALLRMPYLIWCL